MEADLDCRSWRNRLCQRRMNSPGTVLDKAWSSSQWVRTTGTIKNRTVIGGGAEIAIGPTVDADLDYGTVKVIATFEFEAP